MIAKLSGIVDSYGEDFVVVDVNGVGYLVHCSARTLQSLPGTGEAITLAIETYVREDQIRLFGFQSDVEREWFRLLQTVQGVGARVALSVLGTLKPSDLANAVALRDKAMVARTPGVGPKVAGSPAPSKRSARRSRSPTRSRRWSISATASRRPRPPLPPRRAARAMGRMPQG